MSGDWFEWLIQLIGTVLIGMAIKMMDDTLDAKYDQCAGKETLAVRLGRASTPYALLLLSLGVFILRDTGLALFLACYAVGMGHDIKDKMPTGLPGWGEGIAAIAIGIVLTNSLMMLWAVLIIATVQILDDIVDIQKDGKTGQRNIVQRFGIVEATLILLVCFLIAVILNPQGTVILLLAVPLVHVMMDVLEGI